MVKVLFVCMGNICRSPTAEVVFRDRIEALGLAQHFEIDSAGTEPYHIGEKADRRSIREAARVGYDLSRHIARQVKSDDFEHYDYLLAMDRTNLN